MSSVRSDPQLVGDAARSKLMELMELMELMNETQFVVLTGQNGDAV